LLFLSGTLLVVNGKLAIAGGLGANLSVKEGQEAACIASLNALAAAKQHRGDLDRLKKLVKLTVLIATTAHRACKGGAPACSNFTIAGKYTEWLLLGSVAVHYEGKLEYDVTKGIVTNNDDANKWVKPTFRKGWELKA
jgi:hypothetical protein